jgi:mycothiol synthase
MPDQLRMRRLSHEGLPEIVLPSGYHMRSYREGDETAWADIINRAGDLGEYTPEKAMNALIGSTKFHPEGLLFVMTDDGEPVATACAWLPEQFEWRWGQLHMVAVVPEHQGKRLSYWVSAAVCDVYRRWGVPEVQLTTDEFRLAAVKVYVNLGFRPVMRTVEHYDRWIDVYTSYGLDELVEGIREQKRMLG